MPELLTVNHIKPQRDCSDNKQLDRYNNLILAPHVDALFDNGLITFKEDGNIILSKRLPRGNLSQLGITPEEKLEVHLDSEKYFE